MSGVTVRFRVKPDRAGVLVSIAPAAAATLALAAVAWVVAVDRMDGMDMGVATELGSFPFFVAAWVSMMGAMMLPGAVPAVARRARSLRPALDVPVFLGSYLAVWTLVGLAVYALYRPHGTATAGALTIAAGLYELTPLKRHFRRRCREGARTGFQFGLSCVGSSIGLMLVLLALGVMSVAWMCVLAALILGQKLLPPKAPIDVPLALAIVALGTLAAARALGGSRAHATDVTVIALAPNSQRKGETDDRPRDRNARRVARRQGRATRGGESSTCGGATNSPAGARSCHGSRSRRSTSSRPTTERRR